MLENGIGKCGKDRKVWKYMGVRVRGNKVKEDGKSKEVGIRGDEIL